MAAPNRLPIQYDAPLKDVISTAKRLLDEQRLALRRADFASLLATSSGFYHLASQLSALDPDTVPRDSTADVEALRREIARQAALIEKAIAATPRPPRTYPGAAAPTANSSILIDRYA